MSIYCSKEINEPRKGQNINYMGLMSSWGEQRWPQPKGSLAQGSFPFLLNQNELIKKRKVWHKPVIDFCITKRQHW